MGNGRYDRIAFDGDSHSAIGVLSHMLKCLSLFVNLFVDSVVITFCGNECETFYESVADSICCNLYCELFLKSLAGFHVIYISKYLAIFVRALSGILP